MSETFVPMRAWLHPQALPEAPAHPEPPPQPLVLEEEIVADETGDAIHEARRFRAALADALVHTLDAVVADLASEVLARELQLAPCDVQRIAERALARYNAEAVSIRVHPSEAALLGSEWRVEGDPSMRRGDVEVVVSSGTIDARLGARLNRVLAEARA